VHQANDPGSQHIGDLVIPQRVALVEQGEEIIGSHEQGPFPRRRDPCNANPPLGNNENVTVSSASTSMLSARAVRRDFEELFRMYHPVIVRAAFNRLSDLPDAEDAAAEVFAQAWRRREEAEHVFTIVWLYATLRNVVGNQYRGRVRHARRVERAEAGSSRAVVNDDLPDVLDVRAAVHRLEPADRELIWMAYWEDLTREEIANILGCTPTTLRVRLHRARRKLQEFLASSRATVEEGRWTTSN
jgi:RNA polymerase sigma factor (sigma-70 family)